MNTKNRSSLYIWVPLGLGLLMLPIPLLRDFHIESALVVSLAGCFWAAWRACSKEQAGNDWRSIVFILKTLYFTGVPLLIYTVVAGCLSLHGIGFWILFPIPGVMFGYSIGRLLRQLNISYRCPIAIFILLFVAAGVLLIEFFNFPQVYFFNHVWGGWPGPIYDETVKVTWSLIFFRGLTLAWAGLLWWLPVWTKSPKAKALIISFSLLLIAGYSQLAEMGIISPRSYLQQQLDGEQKTAHFTLYYDAHHYTDNEISFIAKKHEFYFRQIVEQLNIEWPDDSPKIESYLYAHPWQKKKLVGAKFTSYVPVWLDQDQLHIARPQIEGSLKHELVHVIAKQFGNKLFNASRSIGLIEGLAVAVAPGESRLSTVGQIVVSEKPYPTAAEMKHALSLLGFYSGRSAVNYTQSGSFVQYLLKNYPVNNFKKAYKEGHVSQFYQPSFDSLITGWHRSLDSLTVDSTDKQVAARLYGFPSLFEQKCPHVQSAFAQWWDKYRFFMAEDDTVHAVGYLNKAYKEAPENRFVKNRWAYMNLKVGNAKKVQQHAVMTDTSAEGLLLYADAFALKGKLDTAKIYVEKAAWYLQQHPDSLLRKALKIRQDSMQWRFYRKIVYQRQVVDDSTFKYLYHRTQMRIVQQMIDHRNWPKMKHYAGILANHKKYLAYFDTYIQLIEKLAFFKEYDRADQWLNDINALSLRPRYRERLQQAQKWIWYLQQKEEYEFSKPG